MDCDMDFGEYIFPDKSMFDPAEPTVVKMFGARVDKMMSVREYAHLSEKYAEQQAARTVARATWLAENPGVDPFQCPYRTGPGGDLKVEGVYFNPRDWKPFDPTHLYFDECLKEVADRVKEYNRIALIIQGLFDRSEVLHPHAPVQSWTPEGFERAITLVYDGTMVLPHGDAPDIQAYLAACNAQIGPDSILTGQEDFWLRREAQKENKRLDNDWRDRGNFRHTKFMPYGDEGPGRVARPAEWKPRAKVAVFAWGRPRRSGGSYGRTDDIRATVSVPAAALFNISAYTPGDFKQFFQDVRTRQQYLKWAPALLTAEDYYAGKLTVQDPVVVSS